MTKFGKNRMIARKCKKCGSLNIEAEVKVLVPVDNDQLDGWDLDDLIDCGEETGLYFCRDCVAFVESEVAQT